MRVCDITRSDECVSTVKVSALDPDTGESVDQEYEVGKAAFEAFKAGDWRVLNELTPPKLRSKSDKRQAGAAKAAQTRAQSRAARVGEQPGLPSNA